MPLNLDRMIDTPFFGCTKASVCTMRLRPAGATRSGRRSGCEAAGAAAELRRAGSQNGVVRMPSVEDAMREVLLRLAYSIVFGIIKFNMMPTTVESATPPKLNTKSLPTVNCKIPPPMPMTMMTDEIVRLRLSL